MTLARSLGLQCVAHISHASLSDMADDFERTLSAAL
jgi:hypothetical protein